MNWSFHTDNIPDSHMEVYVKVIREATRRGLRFAAGGSFALSYYASLNRCFKDLDLCVLPEDKDELVGILTETGLEDYHAQEPYDRDWIYRGWTENIILDVIWAMANRKANVDLSWLLRGPTVDFGGEALRLIPLEEVIWTKLYVLQRDRCDWPDLINVIDHAGAQIDWSYLLRRVGEDGPLLDSLIRIFCWLKPERRASLPKGIWEALAQNHGEASGPEVTARRAALLDSRPWLTSLESNEC